MKTIFQKDLRENFKLALIGAAIFILLLMQAYQSSINTLINLLDHNGSVMAANLQPLLSQTLLMEAAFFCAIFGAALGWLQTRNEAHRDLWAYLVHRPVSRADIFRGKAFAGLCLYAFGAGLPLLGLTLVVATPGHIAAPFEWPMTQPLLAVFLTGPVFYFAGMLTGLRQARWFGSKCFGFGGAVAASLAIFAANDMVVSLLITLVAAGILALAARGAYQSGGFYQGQPAAGKFALTIATLAGCGAVMFVAVGLTITLGFQPFTPRQDYTYSYHQMTRGGKIYKVTQTGGDTQTIVDLDGKPLLDPKTGKMMEKQEFQKLSVWGDSVTSRFNDGGQFSAHYILYPFKNFYRLWNVVDRKLWYVDCHGRLLGYDGVTRQFIGSIEPRGADGATAETFLPPSSQNGDYFYSYSYYRELQMLASAQTVYRIDLKKLTANPVFSCTNSDEIGAYQESFRSELTSKILISTRKSVRLLERDGQTILEADYVPAFTKYPNVQLMVLRGSMPTHLNRTNEFALCFTPDYRQNEKTGWKMTTHYAWFTADKGITRTLDLPVLHTDGGPTPLYDRVASSLVPFGLVAMSEKLDAKHLLGLESGLSLMWTLAAGIIGLLVVRRYHFSTRATAGWTIFVLLLGIPGLLTLLCVQEWPARETCPGCKKLRAVDRECCEHCAAEFSAPETNGTEIFAPLVKA